MIQQVKIANLNKARREKVQTILNLEKEINEYKKDLDERETHEFVEKIARKNYGMVKDEDFIFENKEERQAENLRKMFLAMSKDIRVLIIKLADRLHNLRTINYMTENKIKEKCNETLDIYAPLASRLGIYSVKFELEDISLKYLYPEAYKDLRRQINEKKEEREKHLSKIIKEIDETLADMDIKYEIYGRTKHFYSIFRKMQYKKKNLNKEVISFIITVIWVVVITNIINLVDDVDGFSFLYTI